MIRNMNLMSPHNGKSGYMRSHTSRWNRSGEKRVPLLVRLAIQNLDLNETLKGVYHGNNMPVNYLKKPAYSALLPSG
ncbi:hypothetical protein SAMN05444162_0881 [Paenibacillaceae bacterium GAS479]|nr:hypothetical protein SAMN05444162_0881 [Paenibacillaceae bacterium GAS479]